MVISPDGQKIAEENGFVEMPSALVNLAKQAIQMVQWPDDMVPFTFETEDDTAFTPAKTQKELGMQPRVISAKRTCYGDYERKQMLVKVNELNSDSFASSSSLNGPAEPRRRALHPRCADLSPGGAARGQRRRGRPDRNICKGDVRPLPPPSLPLPSPPLVSPPRRGSRSASSASSAASWPSPSR